MKQQYNLTDCDDHFVSILFFNQFRQFVPGTTLGTDFFASLRLLVLPGPTHFVCELRCLVIQ